MEIKRLSPALLDDWLAFFDKIAFADNPAWSGCYCMCYHWTEDLNRQRSWDCSKAAAPFNRSCAAALICSGKMQGYLAYEDGIVVGWCNANEKDAYHNVLFTPPHSAFDDDHRVKCIMCFCIAPTSRGKGIASALLERVCTDASADGFDCVEVYPFDHDENNAYHGPKTMYLHHGFAEICPLDGVTVYRKMLR